MDGGLTAGIDLAKGDALVLKAADLQDSPEPFLIFCENGNRGMKTFMV
jgi:hypothetical protein